MALNFVQLSRCGCLFVANQLRVCARYGTKPLHRHYSLYQHYMYPWVPLWNQQGNRSTRYQQSLTGYRSDVQNVSDVVALQSPHKSQVRAKHVGNKSGSCIIVPPPLSKTPKDKKFLPRMKSCIESAQKSVNKEKLKIYRPRIVSSSATNLNSDFKLQKIIKLLKESKAERRKPRDKTWDVVGGVRTNDTLSFQPRPGENNTMKKNQPLREKDSKDIVHNNKSNKSSKYMKSNALRRSKSVDELSQRKSDLNQDGVVPIMAAVREMVDSLTGVLQHLDKLERAVRVQKTKEYLQNLKLSDGNIPLKKSARKATISPSVSILPIEKTINVRKANAKKSNSTGEDKTAANVGKLRSTGNDTSLEKINQEISQLRRERNAVKDSVRHPQDKPSDKGKETEELLEIRPTYVENIVPDLNAGISKKTDSIKSNNSPAQAVGAQAVPTMTVSKDMQAEKGFILVDTARSAITRSKIETNMKSQDNGFILVDTEEANSKTGSAEKGFVIVNSDVNAENNLRRSKQEPKNVVLINDNPLYTLRPTETSPRGSKAQPVSTSKEGVPSMALQDANVKVSSLSDGIFENTGLYSKMENSVNSMMSSQNQSQPIGSSKSREEMQQQFNSLDDGTKGSLFATERAKSNVTGDCQPLNQEFQKRGTILEKLDDKRSKTLTRFQNDKSPESKADYFRSVTKVDDKIKGGITASKGHDAINENGQSLEEKGTRKKCAYDLSDLAFENLKIKPLRYNIESTNGNKNKEDTGVKSLNPFLDPRTQRQSKTLTNEASPVSSDISKLSNTDSPSKLKLILNKVILNRTDSYGYTIKHKKSPTAQITELKPELRQKKKDKRSTQFSHGVVKSSTEPQLYVKPEEVSKKPKQFSAPGTCINSPKPTIFTHVTNSDHRKANKTPVIGLDLSVSKSRLPDKEKQKPWPKVQLAEMKIGKKDKLNEKGKNSGKLEKSIKKSSSLSSLADTDRSRAFKNSISLSDLFRQMRRSNSSELSNNLASESNKDKIDNKHKHYQTLASNANVGTSNTGSARRNNELIRELQERWSKEFHERTNNLQQASSNSPGFKKNANCSVMTPPDSNNSSEKATNKSGINLDTKGATMHKVSVLSNTDQLQKKSRHLPTMGMAERLLAASKTSPDTQETGKNPHGVKNSDSSVSTHTDATITQGTAEIDDFPEVDQFEEWIQANMPDIYKDNEGKIFQNQSKQIDQPSKQIPPDNLQLSSFNKCQSPSIYEGSNVDGQPHSSTVDKQEKPINFAGTIFQSRPFFDLSCEEESSNDRHLHKETRDTSFGTASNVEKRRIDSYLIEPTNTTDSLIKKETSAGADKYSQVFSGSQQLLHKAGLNTTAEVDSFASTVQKGDLISTLKTSNTQNTRSSSKFKIAKSSRLQRSLDGFVTMTVIQEEADLEAKTLKPTLKSPKYHEHGEEKRVSFTAKPWKNDSSKTKGERTERAYRDFNDSFGSAVDRRQLEGNFVGDKTLRDMDQCLKTGTVKKLKHNVECDQSPSTSQDTPKTLVQDSEKTRSSVLHKAKKRKYSDEYMKYRVSFIGDEDCAKPHCVVCREVLSNGSMKPSLLLRHLQTKHPSYENKERNFFQRLSKQQNVTSYLSSANKDNENAVEASYCISYRTAKCGKNHTIAENLISPCIKDAVLCMLGEEHVRKMNAIPLSNNTISRRMQDMSDDVEATIISRIKNSKFVTQ